MRDKLMIIDGSSLLYRAFFALPLLTSAHGEYTNAVYGFLNMLLKLYKELEPQYVAVAFDKGKYTFRNDLYADYKATRKAAPDELATQFALIREVLACLGIRVLEEEGYEGDDIIGTVAKEMNQESLSVAIITGDRDALQLVTEHVTVYLTKKGISQMEKMTPDTVLATYGYTPAQVIEMKALMGDASDNIPGVAGVGEKTALKLLTQFHTLDNLYAHVDEVKGTKLQEKLKVARDNAFLSKQLAAINCSVPLEYTRETFSPQPHRCDVNDLFNRLGFKNLLPKFAEFNRFDIPVASSVKSTFTTVAAADYTPAKLAEKTLAVECTYSGVAPFKEITGMAIAFEKTVVWVERDLVFNYSEALTATKKIITTDGKCFIETLALQGIKNKPLVFDLTLGAYLLEPTRTSYGMAYLCDKFDVPMVTTTESDPMAELSEKAICSLQLYDKINKALQDKKLNGLFSAIETPLLYTLSIMEQTGITVDCEKLKQLQQVLTNQAAILEKNIYELVGHKFNINSSKQLGVVLFDELGLQAVKKTKTGYSTDAEVLEILSSKHDVVDLVVQFRTLQKLISTYLAGMEPLINTNTNRIHTSFNQMVTATGRLSSSEPNLQNIPVRTELGRKIRSLFIPGTDFDYLLSADYSQIELRLLAHLSQDEHMLDAFNKQQDIHQRTASEVFGIPLDAVTKEQRSHAKAVNFGIIYGISDFGLAKNIKITRDQAKLYIDGYFARYGQVKEYLEKLVQDAHETNFTATMFGRIRYLPEINSKNFNRRSFAERTAMNTPIQGSAADIIKIAMNRVQEELTRSGYHSHLLLQVHDELVLEVPKSELSALSTMVKEVMESVVNLSIPLLVDVNVGKNWAEAK